MIKGDARPHTVLRQFHVLQPRFGGWFATKHWHHDRLLRTLKKHYNHWCLITLYCGYSFEAGRLSYVFKIYGSKNKISHHPLVLHFCSSSSRFQALAAQGGDDQEAYMIRAPAIIGTIMYLRRCKPLTCTKHRTAFRCTQLPCTQLHCSAVHWN